MSKKDKERLSSHVFVINDVGTKKAGTKSAEKALNDIISGVPKGYKIDGIGIYAIMSPKDMKPISIEEVNDPNRDMRVAPDVLTNTITVAHPPINPLAIVIRCMANVNRWMPEPIFNAEVTAEVMTAYLDEIDDDESKKDDLVRFLLENGPGRELTIGDLQNLLHTYNLPFEIEVKEDPLLPLPSTRLTMKTGVGVILG